ncbi:SAM-dependent methyltransferase [Solicola gregarius]|uniref:Class I SAM-dependent methyltransferase n=1 Tax=Solicola gregarius TaxID=2908642 RepID=A0AA46TM42_9ACTN|nr:methyltransferase domain-containing protein [Solicola gregarius]UYM07653.1 class I SAM-dependent methyltransferase [Solicola gregarius]
MALRLDPPYVDLTFMSPLSDQRAEELASFLAAAPAGTIVDVGCGWAELLLRAVEQSDAHTGVGIDLDGEAIAHGRKLAAARGLADRVALVAGDGRTSAPRTPAAVISIGASQIWRRDSDDERLPYASALAGLRALVDRDAHVVFGDGIWSVPPTREATAALGGPEDEMVDLANLVDFAEEAGFMPMAIGEASVDEWDEFESGFTACYTRWVSEHPPDHPDADEARSRARRQRDAYLRGYRGVLGLAYLQLVAV